MSTTGAEHTEAAPQQAERGTSSKMLRFFANLISYVFHPVFITTGLAFVIYKLYPANFAGLKQIEITLIIGTIAVNTIMFPLITVLLLKALGFIESIQMYKQKDRIIPLIGIMMWYFWANLVMKNMSVAFPGIETTPVMLQVLVKGAYWNVIAMFMCSIFFKISMHTVAAGGMLGMFIVLLMVNPVSMTIPLFIAIIIAGIIGTARLLLGAHTQFEIWSGYILGIIVQLGAYWYIM